MSNEGKSNEPLDVLLPYNYTQGEEVKTAWTEVGIAWPSKDGLGVNVDIKPGLSVAGRLVLRPRKKRPAKDSETASEHEAPARFIYAPGSDLKDLV